MTLTEKIANLDTEAPAIASLGLNAYNWWSEATHGVAHVNTTGDTPAATNFVRDPSAHVPACITVPTILVGKSQKMPADC